MENIKNAFILLCALIFFLIVRANIEKNTEISAAPVSAPVELAAEGWLNSGPVTLAGNKGKIMVVEFWATWCPPCRKSIPELIELYNFYGKKGVVFAALTDESLGKVEPFAKKMNMNYPVGYGSKTFKKYGVTGIPHAFLIGRDGKIKWNGHDVSELYDELKKEYQAR